MAPLIKRGTVLPCKQTKLFTTHADNQDAVLVQVYEGESVHTTDCNLLGQFRLEIPPAPKQVPRIEVTFAIDENGILSVSAKDLASGTGEDIVITKDEKKLTEAQLKKMMEVAAKRKAAEDRRKRFMNLMGDDEPPDPTKQMLTVKLAGAVRGIFAKDCTDLASL